jgi:hypothetical protein
MPKYVFEVLQEVAKQRLKEDKIRILRQNESWALKDVLRGTFDSKVVWNLPEGTPPYTPTEAHNHPANLLRENKKFKYFVKGIKEGDALPKFKREKLFLGMLEGVHPEDAKVLIEMINKRPPKYITRPIVEEAFPGLLRD